MKIVDFREAYRDELPLERIEKAISLIPADEVVGIRELRLYDEDPRSNKHTAKAYARYVHKSRLRWADIELYFWRLSDLEEDLRKNQLYVLFILIRSFFHELYHHKIRAQRRLRKPKKQTEENRANEFAQVRSSEVIHKLFPRWRNRPLWRSMERLTNKQGEEPGAESA